VRAYIHRRGTDRQRVIPGGRPHLSVWFGVGGALLCVGQSRRKWLLTERRRPRCRGHLMTPGLYGLSQPPPGGDVARKVGDILY